MQPSHKSEGADGELSHAGGFGRLEQSLLKELAGEVSKEHLLSKRLPEIFLDSDYRRTAQIFEEFGRNFKEIASFFYEPELMTLLSLKLAHLSLRTEWAETLVGIEKADGVSEKALQDLTFVLGKCGELAFSFPIWRFPAQRVKDGEVTHLALLEKAGMERVQRQSDTYVDAGVTKDWLGVGFVSRARQVEATPASIRKFVSEDTHIEYRRSYLLVSNPEGTLIIRNSSHFFGRDRLKNTAYFSPQSYTERELIALTDKEIDAGKDFLSITSAKLYQGYRGFSAEEIASKMRVLIDELLSYDEGFSDWMLNTKRPDSNINDFSSFVVEDLSARFQAAKKAATNSEELQKRLPVLGFIEEGSAPWHPYATLKLDGDRIAILKKIASGEDLNGDDTVSAKLVRNFLEIGFANRAKLVLMSGEQGDRPH